MPAVAPQATVSRAPPPASVSVVVPCYCCAAVLERAVLSVLGQGLPPAEIILVDDCSPDGGATRACIATLIDRHDDQSGVRMRFVPLDDNRGPGGARNAGWDVARESYVAFLDADDAWHQQKIAVQYAWMAAHTDFDLSCHGSRLVTEGAGGEHISAGGAQARAIGLRDMLFKNRVLTSTVMLRRSLPQRFAPGARYAEDYALWTTMMADGCAVAVLDAPLTYTYRAAFSAGGQSERLWTMEAAELRIYRGLAQGGKIGWMAAYVASGVSFAKYLRRLVVRHLAAGRR